MSYPELGFKEMDQVVKKLDMLQEAKALAHIVEYSAGRASTISLKELVQM